MYSYIVWAVVDILETLVFLIGVYYMTISVFSLFNRRPPARECVLRSFAAVIPAHNEESVLAELISGIRSADYPQNLIRIIVVADGCTDGTAHLARRLGAEVLERAQCSGKGAALADAFDYITNGAEVDAVCVFDADNLVDSRFFREINERLQLGARAVQGYIDSKNPYASWVSCAHSLWYWITNRTAQTGRARLGIGCRIGGTGFALGSSLLKEIPWQTCTFAEDAEYTCMLAENGVRVDYAESAVVYDEKPGTFGQSVMQRRRWAHGMRDVQGEYTLRLMARRRINALLGLWGDVLSVFAAAVMLAVVIAAQISGRGIWSTAVGAAAVWIYLAVSLGTVLLALITDKKMNQKIILNTFGFLIYIVSWIPIGIFGIFDRKTDNWYHTEHRSEV